MSPSNFERVRTAVIGMILFASIVLYLSLPISLINWAGTPFIGLFLDPNLVVNESSADEWPGRRVDPPLSYPEQIISIDGETVQSLPQLRRHIVNHHDIGDVVEIQVVRPEDDSVLPATIAGERFVQLPLLDVAATRIIDSFWLFYGMGAAVLLVAIWSFYVRPGNHIAQMFTVSSIALAFLLGGYTDTLIAHTYARIWVASLALAGPLLLVVAFQFPYEIILVRRWRWVKWLPLLPGLVVFVWTQLWLYRPEEPWAYVITWRWAYLLNGFCLLISLFIFAWRGLRASDPLARQQGRFITVAAFIAFAPITFWLLFERVIDLPFLARFYLPVMVIYPVSIGYTIIRYRLLNVNIVLRQGIPYLLATVLLVGGFAGVVAILTSTLGQFINQNNPILLAVFVLIVTVTFDPLRNMLRLAIDQYLFHDPVQLDNMLSLYNRALTHAVTLEQVSEILLKHVISGIPDTSANLYLPDQLLAVNGQGTSPTAIGQLGLHSQLVNLFQVQRSAVYVAEEKSWPAAFRPYKSALQALDAAVVVPLHTGDELLGWLTVSDKQNGRPFTEAELFYLNALADQSIISLERVKVVQRLERRVAELNMLSQFSQALNRSTNLEELLELIMDQCQRLLDTKDFYVFLHDPELDQLYTAIHLENNTRRPELEGTPPENQDPLVVEVMHSGEFHSSRDDEGRIWLTVPLNAGSDTIGVLQTFRLEPEARFAQREEQLLSLYADRAAAAIERWYAAQQQAQLARQMATLNEVTLSINAVLNPNHLLELILDKAMELLRAEAGGFLLVVDETRELEFQVVRGPASETLVGTRLPLGTGLAGHVAQTGQPSIVNDPQRDPRWFGGVDASTEYQTKAILTVPLLQGHHVIGVLQVMNKENGAPFYSHDRQLLQTFAGQAVAALEKARLIHQTDEQLQHRVNELALLQELDRDLNNTLDLQSVLRLTLNWAIRIGEGAAGNVIIFDDEGNIVAAATHGYDDEFDIWALGPVAAIGGITGEVMRSGKPMVVNDVARSAHYLAANTHTRAQVSTPIVHKQKTIGVLSVESPHLDGFEAYKVETIMRVVLHASTAIANALLYNEVIEANLAKSEFVSMVSHELKTPITAIKGYADLMLAGMTGKLSEQQQTYLETITGNVSRMKQLIQDLTDISRIETGRLSVSPEPIAFANVVSETMQIVQPICQGKNTRVELDLPMDLPPIKGDQTRLVQVLTNLISNASKYSPPDTRVDVRVWPQESTANPNQESTPMIVCVVQDHGYGISEADQARLFTKFFRSEDPNIRQSSGTGLGLSITRGIIELHGGKIWLESEVGRGTSFYFSLPQATGM